MGAFTFYSDLSRFDDDKHDEMLNKMYSNPFLDLNKCIKQMFEVIIDRGVYWIDNSACLKVPKHVEIKIAFDGDRIHSIDTFVFCMEEIDLIHRNLFAETTMFEKLPELVDRIGEDFDYQYKIQKVNSKLKDGYYHGVGLKLVKEDGSTSFQDVYSLTRWYYDNVFPKPKEEEKD